MQAAPINPSDVNIVQGSYGSKIRPPATAGSEGVGVVQKVGPGVTNLKENDRVILANDGAGTWSSHLITSSNNLFKVSQNIPLEYAACLSVNPTTAFRLLADFENLKSGKKNPYFLSFNFHCTSFQLSHQTIKKFEIFVFL